MSDAIRSDFSRLFVAALVLIVVLGMGEIFYATSRWGVDVNPDSVVYLTTARELAAGRGLYSTNAHGEREPLLRYEPPLYPAVLSGPVFLGVNPVRAARWLNVLIFGCTILIGSLIVWRQTRRRALVIAAAALLAVAPPLLLVNVEAMTDPLFILLSLGALGLAAEHLDRPRPWILAAAGALAAMAILTRSAGVALVPALCASVALFSRQAMGRRLRDAVIVGLIICIPYGTWTIIHGSGHALVVHLIDAKKAADIADTVRGWVLPNLHQQNVAHGSSADSANGWMNRMPDWMKSDHGASAASTTLALLILGLVIMAPLQFRRRDSTGPAPRGAHLFWLFALSYPAMIVATVCFVDADLPMTQRIFSPLYVTVLLLAFCVASRRQSTTFKVLAVIAAVCFAADFARAALQLSRWHRDGAGGYTSKVWQESPTLARVKAMRLSPDAAIYSNEAEAVSFCLDHTAIPLPDQCVFTTGLKNEHYPREIADITRQLRRRPGIIVFFDAALNRSHMPRPDELGSAMSLHLIAKTSDGAIYELAQPAPSSGN